MLHEPSPQASPARVARGGASDGEDSPGGDEWRQFLSNISARAVERPMSAAGDDDSEADDDYNYLADESRMYEVPMRV